MAFSLLNRNKIIPLLSAVRKTSEVIFSNSNKTIMTGRVNLEKALESLQKNPYYDKYAQKISKLQETSPEEFLQRVEEKERKAQEEKVHSNCIIQCKKTRKSQWSWSITSQLWRTNIQKQSLVRAYSQMVNEYKYITTPIFYVNDVPHIGHLYTAAMADAIARFHSMQGHNTKLITGTDEHGNKVQQAADKLKLPTDEYCFVISNKFKDMCDTFGIGYSNFIRTTDEIHKNAVQSFWGVLSKKNHIYKGKYSGWYCVSDEAFLSEQEIVEKTTESGKTIKVSAESGHIVEWSEEENYKFRLSSFNDDLKYWLKNEKVIQPLVFHKIVSRWIEEDYCTVDLSVSRPTSRVPWGIPTPDDPNQTIYVWFDALINYLSALGYPDDKFKKFWPPTVQVIGKDILKFHGIYWPAFLIAAGLEPPRVLLCHSHWTVNDEKMSKSKGNVVSPFTAAQKFTDEGLRYFLLRDSVPQNDANYSTERVLNILNHELADTLGNLVSRCSGKIINPNYEIPSAAVYAKSLNSESADRLRQNIESLADTAKAHYESFYFHHVIDAVMATLKSANVMVEYHKPWVLRKQTDDEAAATELKSVVALALEAARVSAIVMYPIVPKLSTNLLNLLNVPMTSRSWSDTKPKYFSSFSNAEARPFGHENSIIFPKIKLKNVSC